MPIKTGAQTAEIATIESRIRLDIAALELKGVDTSKFTKGNEQ